MSPNSDDTGFSELCRKYYSNGDGYFNGSAISDLQRALNLSSAFQNEFNGVNPCVDLVMNYLCHYYFPLCDLTTGEITPVCSSSCALLANNQDCSASMETAMMQLAQHNVSFSDSCRQTYRLYVEPPQVSAKCLSIEG